MKIGFACKIYLGNKKQEATYNFNTTTVKSLTSKNIIEQKEIIEKLCFGNITKLEKQLKFVLSLPKENQMFRIGSDILPLFTHISTQHIYKDPSFMQDIAKELNKVGKIAIENQIRLSFHPGQFTVLGSLNENVVINSIEELEYHTLVFNLMGIDGWHPNGACINIHAGSKQSPLQNLIKNIKRCSLNCQNLLTIENDEFSYSIEDLEPIYEFVPVVLDIHHQWIKTEKYISPHSDTIKKIINSWRGARPKIHYSISKYEYLGKLFINELPNFAICSQNKINKTTLREHSSSCWNKEVNNYALSFLSQFDIMCEMKHKNKASSELLTYFQELTKHENQS